MTSRVARLLTLTTLLVPLFVALLPGLGKKDAIDATMQLWENLRDARFLSPWG